MSEDDVTPDRPFRQRPLEDAECDYCGRLGCVWQNHDQARTDVLAWQRRRKAADDE